MNQFKINIKATNFQLTPELENYVDSKLSHVQKFLNLQGDQEVIAYVEIEKVAGAHHRQGNIFRAEINLNFRGTTFRASETREEFFVAIDEVVQELIRQIRKTKERRIDLVRRGGKMLKKLLRFGRED